MRRIAHHGTPLLVASTHAHVAVHLLLSHFRRDPGTQCALMAVLRAHPNSPRPVSHTLYTCGLPCPIGVPRLVSFKVVAQNPAPGLCTAEGKRGAAPCMLSSS